MTGQQLRDVVLRAAGVPRRFTADSDGELLGRFVTGRDAAAFAELVRRHGAMVLGVARRELGDTADVDDVCQATFLVLARKAAAVRRADAVGAWLYGVARRIARKHGAAIGRRRQRETPLTDLPGPDTAAAVSLRDGLRVLDEELARLPDGYRAPLVLCYLEGRTQDEAAKQLGWSLGAFRGRLERGRARLRDRLTRRGVGLAILAAAAAARPTAVSAAMQSSIINTAAAVAAGEALTIPAAAAVLAEGAIRAMSMTKLQWAIGVTAVCGMLTVGGVWATGQGPGQPAAGTPRALTTPPTGDDVKREVSVQSMPPAVIKTLPQAGETRIDAAKVTEIRVTFSKEMMDKSWSWSQISADTFPEVNGKPSYEKGNLTCVLPVKLEPGKTYVIWLNSEKFTNFKDAGGRPAVPYLLVFETKK